MCDIGTIEVKTVRCIFVQKGESPYKYGLSDVVGVARFELATSRPPDARATKLRYTPTLQSVNQHK